MKRVKQSARWLLVTIGIVALTSVTVDATIGKGGVSQSALAILATTLSHKVEKKCPDGTTELGGDFARVCVDLFEASPADTCPSLEVHNANDTRANMAAASCAPQSKKDAQSWTFATKNQAQELCARAGKRLLSNGEWYRTSLGTPDIGATSCNISTNGAEKTGTHGQCVSGVGAYDTIGNVWEWVDGDVEHNIYASRTLPLPQSGYVAEADGDGVVTKTAEAPQVDYHDDYFWTTESGEEGVFGMLRGGFYGSSQDAGLYSLQAKTAPSFSGAAIGFRCAFDLH